MRIRLFWTIVTMLCIGCNSQADSNQHSNSDVEHSTENLSEFTEVTLALNWFPEAEHGGFYAALVHGYYEEAGLKVKIIPGGPNAPVIQRVASDDVMFGVSNADQVLLGRAQEADIIAVMSPMQASPRCIMVHKKSGIQKFEDLKDITLAMSSTATFANFLKQKVPLTNVQIVPYPGNVTQFLLNDDYAQQGYVFSEPYIAKKEGGDPYNLMLSDLGFNPYTSLLFCRTELIEQQPELVQKMVTATVRGWQTYLESSDKTNQYIQQQNPEMGLEILAYGAKSLQPLCVDESTTTKQLGRMTLERWQTLTDQLVESEAIQPDVVDVSKAFTTQFLETNQ